QGFMAGCIPGSPELAALVVLLHEGVAQRVDLAVLATRGIVRCDPSVVGTVGQARFAPGQIIGITPLVTRGIDVFNEVSQGVVTSQPLLAMRIDQAYLVALRIVAGLPAVTFAVGICDDVSVGVMLEVLVHVRGHAAIRMRHALEHDLLQLAPAVVGVEAYLFLRLARGPGAPDEVSALVVLIAIGHTGFVDHLAQVQRAGLIGVPDRRAVGIGDARDLVERVTADRRLPTALVRVGRAPAVPGAALQYVAVDLVADQPAIAVDLDVQDASPALRFRIADRHRELFLELVVVVAQLGLATIGGDDLRGPALLLAAQSVARDEAAGPGAAAAPAGAVGKARNRRRVVMNGRGTAGRIDHLGQLGAAVLEPRDVAPGVDHPDPLVVAVLVGHAADGPVQRRVVADLGHELCVAVRVEQREHGAAVVVEHALDLAVAAVLEPHAHIVAVAVAGDPATVVVLDPLPAAIGPAEALDRARGQAGITACRMRIGTRAGWQPEHLLRADHETWVIAAAVARAIAADREAHALAGQ